LQWYRGIRHFHLHDHFSWSFEDSRTTRKLDVYSALRNLQKGVQYVNSMDLTAAVVEKNDVLKKCSHTSPASMLPDLHWCSQKLTVMAGASVQRGSTGNAG
jgi:hypothetical protein